LLINYNSVTDIEINLNSENCESDLYFIFVWEYKKTGKWKILCNINSSYSKANIYILSFLTDWSEIDVDGNIIIWKNIKKVEWYLMEENVIIWEKIKIKTKPILNIYSNDVKASHWAKIDKIDSNKLFYMTSRWIDEEISKNLIIDWYLNNIFENFPNNEPIEKMKKEIIIKLLQKYKN
jgi:Fe-S cluster assembly protein SufD